MPEDEVKNKNFLKDLVRTIFDTNQKLDNMPPLETKEEAKKKTTRTRIKNINSTTNDY